MVSHVTLLFGDKPSTKCYRIEDDKALKGEVSTAYLHSGVVIPLSNLADLFEAISIVRQDPAGYIIRGKPEQDTFSEMRRLKENFHEVGTQWICCDFDSYEVPTGVNRTSLAAIEHLIDTILPATFKNVSYIYQWSASAGLEYNGPIKQGTNVHLFFYLSTFVTDQELIHWFDQQIADGFDKSTFNTVTPIFVGSHVEKDQRIIDIIDEEDKFGIVMKENDHVQVPIINVPVRKVLQMNSLSADTNSDILQKIYSVGCVHRRGGGYIKVWHPIERTRGDWYIRTDDPMWVGHQVKKSMRVDKWLKEFWSVDLGIDLNSKQDRPGYGKLTNRKILQRDPK